LRGKVDAAHVQHVPVLRQVVRAFLVFHRLVPLDRDDPPSLLDIASRLDAISKIFPFCATMIWLMVGACFSMALGC
jgi:hypothetical protein